MTPVISPTRPPRAHHRGLAGSAPAATPTTTRCFHDRLACSAPPARAPASGLPRAPAPMSLASCCCMPGGVATPRAHLAPTPAARSSHHHLARSTPSSAPTTSYHLLRPPTPAAPRSGHRRRRAHATTTPSALLRGCLLAGSTTTAGCYFRCHALAFLSSDYGADTATERDRAFDLEPLRVRLADADVLVGDVHLPVPVAVGLSPRFGFACRPRGTVEQ